MTIAEITEKLAEPDKLSDAELRQLELMVAGELAGIEGDDARAIAQLGALQTVSGVIGRAFASRERTALAASAAPESRRGGKIASMARRQGRAKPSPEMGGDPGRAVLTAAAEMPGIGAGNPITDREAFAEGICHVLRRITEPGKRSANTLIASARFDYPEDRRLGGDQARNNRLIDAVCSPDALVATGGICGPVSVDWSLPTFATPDRPLRDGLPQFLAPRGGLSYRQPLDIGTLSAAVSVWTEATDLNPMGATKPIYSVSCPATITVLTDAVTQRLGLGNMMSRFDPETMAMAVDLAVAAHAKLAEQNLLNHIASACVQTVTAPAATTGLGAARDFLSTLNEAVAAYRDVHRLSDDLTLTIVLPRWLKNVIRTDLARSMAVAASDTLNPYAVEDSEIEDMLTVLGLNPIWILDGQSSSAPGLSGAVNQYYTAQAGSTTIQKFPTEAVFYLFPEGSMAMLDGGTLDLGIVRDSLLDATNDMEVMTETFEAIAYRGYTAGAYQYIVSLAATGASSGTVGSVPAA